MYTRGSTYLTSNNLDPSLFIEGYDYQNSELLYKLDECNTYSYYQVTKYERRLDLIASDIYGDSKYTWILQYLNKISSNEVVRGIYLKYIPLATLTNLINQV